MKKIFKVIIGTFAWLPVLYSLVFLIISIVTGTIGENWGFYFVGLSVSLIACVALTYLYARRAKPEAPAEEPGDEQPAAPRNELKPVRYDYDESADITARDEANKYASEMKGSPSAVSGERYDRRERSAYMAGGKFIEPAQAPDPTQALDSLGMNGLMGASGMDKYYGTGGGTASGQTAARKGEGDASFSPYVQPANYGGGDGMKLSDYDDARSRAHDPDGEENASPRIYRLRGEPNVLLYEYPDVFKKYYINADGSRTLLSTQYKE